MKNNPYSFMLSFYEKLMIIVQNLRFKLKIYELLIMYLLENLNSKNKNINLFFSR
jgi:hypothetical protein